MSRFLPDNFDASKPLALIAGKGTYPILLAERARSAGIAVRLIELGGETSEKLINTFPDHERSAVKVGQVGKLLKELKKFNAIIIDPPRSGARSQFLNITLSKVPIVISISCNINTFVRDAKILIENNYQLKWVQPIDQFLFSPHVEIVSLFELNLVN